MKVGARRVRDCAPRLRIRPGMVRNRAPDTRGWARFLPVGLARRFRICQSSLGPDGAVGIAENRVSSNSAPRPTPDFSGSGLSLARRSHRKECLPMDLGLGAHSNTATQESAGVGRDRRARRSVVRYDAIGNSRTAGPAATGSLPTTRETLSGFDLCLQSPFGRLFLLASNLK